MFDFVLSLVVLLSSSQPRQGVALAVWVPNHTKNGLPTRGTFSQKKETSRQSKTPPKNKTNNLSNQKRGEHLHPPKNHPSITHRVQLERLLFLRLEALLPNGGALAAAGAHRLVAWQSWGGEAEGGRRVELFNMFFSFFFWGGDEYARCS